MSKKDLQNERIDRTARRLLDAVSVTDAEIEKIVAAPRLFDSVKARIRAEQAQTRKAKTFFPVWNFQTAAGAFAVLLVLLAVATAAFFKTKEAPQIVKENNKPEIKAPAPPSENPLPTAEITKTKATAVRNSADSQKTIFKEDASKPASRERKPNPPKAAQTHKKESKDVFYPLAVAGNWEADGEDLQIVRAELSRSELFALGVNLPVENESARIKTDLLVSSDGVARAIRFVE